MAGLITFAQAVGRLAELVTPLPAQTVALDRAAGRRLSAPLYARVDSPRAAVSAMDGYAVCDSTTQPLQWLDVVGEARPGLPYPTALGAGEAVRLFTGAPVPAGADRVIVQEHAERDGARVRFTAGYGPSRHIRAAGSDFAAGALLLPAGTRLSPRAMIAAAAADVAALAVHRPPLVAIIGTGDELVPPGTAADQPYAVPESVSHGVAALATECGAEVVWRGTHRDDLPGLTGLAGRLLALADVVVVTGGASVGDYDFAKAMFAPHGLELAFSRLAIKPGKPVWLGTAGGRLLLGLPGNPTSAMVTARLFLRPLLTVLQGGEVAESLVWRSLPLAAALPATGDRETFVRAVWNAAGLRPVTNQDSGAQAALAGADWLIRCPVGTPALAAGAMVSALPM